MPKDRLREKAEKIAQKHRDNYIAVDIYQALLDERKIAESQKELEIGEQAREEVTSILNGKSPLFAKPIFDAINLRQAVFAIEDKIRKRCAERNEKKSLELLELNRNLPEDSKLKFPSLIAVSGMFKEIAKAILEDGER